jgi:DNA-binding NtrC family response regulator
MLPLGLLLIGSPSKKRDALELCARRHGALVVLQDECSSLPDTLPICKFTYVVVICDGKTCDLEHHRSLFESRLPTATIIFSGYTTPKQTTGLLKHKHVILIPPARAAETLEPLLSVTEGESDVESSHEGPEKTILLQRKIYALNFREARQQFEKEHIARILERCSGNVSRAARLMDMARRNLQIKIQAYGIDIERIRGVNDN